MRTLPLVLLLIFMCNILIAQQDKPQWVNVSPFLNDKKGNLIGSFVSANEGWVSLISGRYNSNELYYTNDGAQTFEKIFQFDDSLTMFQTIQMLDSKIGYSTALWRNDSHPYNRSNFFLKTTDGGNSWSDITDTAFFNQFYDHHPFYYFINSLIGFTSVYHEKETQIYRTTDGAETWQKMKISGFEESGLTLSDLGISEYFFYDKKHGWAICHYEVDGGLCLKTTDGGETWYPAHNYGTNFWGIDFVSPQKGGIVGRNSFYSHVYLTENNFTTLSYENQAWDFDMKQMAWAIAYQNDSIIWISGEPGTFYRSTNNGQTFDEYQNHLENSISVVYDIYFFNGNVGYAIGYGNTLMKFTDTLSPTIDTLVPVMQNPNTSIKLCPNPLTSNSKIIIKGYKGAELAIYNSAGQNVLKMLVDSDNFTKPIAKENFNEGVYMVTVTINGKPVQNKKIVVVK